MPRNFGNFGTFHVDVLSVLMVNVVNGPFLSPAPFLNLNFLLTCFLYLDLLCARLMMKKTPHFEEGKKDVAGELVKATYVVIN